MRVVRATVLVRAGLCGPGSMDAGGSTEFASISWRKHACTAACAGRGNTKQVTVSKAGALGLRRTLPRGLGLLKQRAVLTGARERALQHGRELAREA